VTDQTGVADSIFVGGGGEGYGQPQRLLLKYGNRHGLIAGATGTGKTVTLQILAEGFSAAGVPVFLSDVKGDLAGIAAPGSAEGKLHEAFVKRSQTIGHDLQYRAFPVIFWDLFGEKGHPVRATVEEMGPLLLSRLLELSEPQEGVLNVAFRLSDEEGLALLDLKDLQALLTFVAENADEMSSRYGLVSKESVGAIQRRLLVLENEGGAALFGEPALDLADLMTVDPDGLGRISILAADRLMNSPRLYATFLLWLLSELFEMLPEVGDPDKPKLVFFFDEAHLLFTDAPKALISKVEQVARLIRSKGVGVYFITQNPADVPDDDPGPVGQPGAACAAGLHGQGPEGPGQGGGNLPAEPALQDRRGDPRCGHGRSGDLASGSQGDSGRGRADVGPPALQPAGPDRCGQARAAVMAGSPVRGKYDTVIWTAKAPMKSCGQGCGCGPCCRSRGRAGRRGEARVRPRPAL
jgi:hypothetical protein